MGWAARIGAALGGWLGPIIGPLERLRPAAVINRYTSMAEVDLSAALANDADFAAVVSTLINTGQLVARHGYGPKMFGVVGEIRLIIGDPPPGWLICAGQTLQTSNYPALFAALGYTHGGAGPEFLLPALTAPAGNYIIYTGAP